MATTIKGVRDAFADEAVAAAFGRKFMEKYAGRAFGVLPRTEIRIAVLACRVQSVSA